MADPVGTLDPVLFERRQQILDVGVGIPRRLATGFPVSAQVDRDHRVPAPDEPLGQVLEYSTVLRDPVDADRALRLLRTPAACVQNQSPGLQSLAI